MAYDSLDVLESQIRVVRRSIASDGYPMSIGELTNLYRDGELIIRPEFQRVFRWSNAQKSRLIESLLLGIPLPSIFVAQTEAGKWELVDGLQRVSTILELQGELRDSGGKKRQPLVLQGTKYLPALDGRCWEDENPEKSLTEPQRLDIKRSKIDVKIIKRESSPEAKFDLFQRLNSYGSELTAQETRSALLVAVSPEFFAWVDDLTGFEPYQQCTQLVDRLRDERYDLELVLRFLVLHNRLASKLTASSLRDFRQFLDDQSVELAKSYPHGADFLANTFRSTFSLLAESCGENAFRRWDTKQHEFKGPFLNTAFEVFALGLGYHIANDLPCRTNVLEVVKEFWTQSITDSGFATGRSTEARLAQFVPLGRQIFSLY